MSESQMRARIVNALRQLDAHAVENAARAGTPDVECILGWLELKDQDFTKGNVLPLRHFKAQQRVWLHRRWKMGGLAVLLIRTNLGWFMLDGVTAAKAPGKDEMWFRENCIASWGVRGPTDKELFECVLNTCAQGKTSSSFAAGAASA